MNCRYLASVICGAIFTALASAAKAALIPPFMLNSVVALGAVLNVSPPGEKPKYEWVTLGTGFFYGHKIFDDADPAKKKYTVFLVTAGHVVSDFRASGHGDLLVRINAKDPSAPSKTFNIQDSGPDTWFYNPNFDPTLPDDSPGSDIAIVQVNAPRITELGASFIPDDAASADSTKLKTLGVAAGDGVFVLGFPMNLAGEQRNYVVVRGGVIARISELLEHAAPTFMLDSFVFPGNSGSPVVLKPEITAIQGTQANNQSYVIGVVTDYKPYTDVAISQQSHRPRITFEENSGLADVIPLDKVDETILAFEALK